MVNFEFSIDVYSVDGLKCGIGKQGQKYADNYERGDSS